MVRTSPSTPTSMETSGCALRLWNQAGLTSSPAYEANTAQPPSAAWYIIGLTRGSPDFAPLVCRSSSGAPSKLPPTLPPLARNSAMTFSFQSLMPRHPTRRRVAAGLGTRPPLRTGTQRRGPSWDGPLRSSGSGSERAGPVRGAQTGRAVPAGAGGAPHRRRARAVGARGDVVQAGGVARGVAREGVHAADDGRGGAGAAVDLPALAALVGGGVVDGDARVGVGD